VGDFSLTFDVDSVLAGARARTGGLDDFGPTPFVEPLGILVGSLAADGMLNDRGKAMAEERLTRHAMNRLNYVNDRKRNAGIAAQKIVKPVFIIGFPRTGTTILHDILAQDPANRAPLTWEVMFPHRRRSTLLIGPIRGSRNARRRSRRWTAPSPPSRRCIRWARGSARNA
jgi:Sulfotransferase family